MILEPKYGPFRFILPIWLIFIALVCVLYVISRNMVEHTGCYSIFFVVWLYIDVFVIAIPVIVMNLLGAGTFTTLYYSYSSIQRKFRNRDTWKTYIEKVNGWMIATSFIPPMVQLVLAFI